MHEIILPPPSDPPSPPRRARRHKRSLADGELKTTLPLQDFLEGLGPLLQLPRRKKPKQAGAPAQSGLRLTLSPALRRGVVMMLGIAALVAGASQFRTMSRASSTETVPHALQGRWSTSQKKYAGRSLDFRSDSIGIYISPKEGTFFPIREIWTREQGDTTIVTVQYEQENGRPTQLAVRLVANRGHLTLANQPEMVWTRQP